MTAKKIIYSICLLILLPLCVYGQDPSRAPKRKVVLPSGDTIVTSSKGGNGLLSKEDMKFFKRDTSSLDMLVDSLYNLSSKYNSLEDAALQVTDLLGEIGTEQDKSKENQSLSFRLSQQNRGRLQKEKEAQEIWEENKRDDKSVEDIVESYERFGDKPTYYINGIEVDESIVNHLRPVDIFSRQYKIVNTISRNPNGEIWFEVPSQVAQKLIGVSEQRESIQIKKPAKTQANKTTNENQPVQVNKKDDKKESVQERLRRQYENSLKESKRQKQKDEKENQSDNPDGEIKKSVRKIKESRMKD